MPIGYNNTRMNRISVLIPDADVRLNVACCLAASRQAIVHGFALTSCAITKAFEILRQFRRI